MSDQIGSFDACLKLVLVSEGGWVNDPLDPGGATNQGVTQRVYDAYRAHVGKTKRSVALIEPAEVGTIYSISYWMPIKGGNLPAGVDYCIFDFAVNSGVAKASKDLQAAVGAAQDGHIGLLTLQRVKACSPADIIDDVSDWRLQFLRTLPTWHHFGDGWTARVERVRAAALAMARR